MQPESPRCVAFLRGVNVGGHKPIKMAELAAAFAGLGLRNVRTVLASGERAVRLAAELRRRG